MARPDRSPRNKALALIDLANQAQSGDKPEVAAVLYRASLAVCPTAEAYTFLAWMCGRSGEWERAVELCRQAIALDPDFGNPYTDIGAYLIQMERYREAGQWIRRASRARRYGFYPYAYFNLGCIFERLGKSFKALEAYRLALRYAPGHPVARRAYRRLADSLN